MGKLIQIYAVVCVTLDSETGKATKMELSDTYEMPVDGNDAWDIEAQEWVTPTDEGALAIEADNMVQQALRIYEQATQAEKAVARWYVCGPCDQQELLDTAECMDEDGMEWKFPDASILRITHDGEHAEAH